MTVSPRWNNVPVSWYGRYLDGSWPTGTLVISTPPMRWKDDDGITTDPIIIMSKDIVIEVTEGAPTNFQLPATDDPDIVGGPFVYTVNEVLNDGGGEMYTFAAPLSSFPNGVKLARVLVGG
jgi:hypothetical protein